MEALGFNLRRIIKNQHPLANHPLLSGKMGARFASAEYKDLLKGTLESSQELKRIGINTGIESRRDIRDVYRLATALQRSMADIIRLEQGHEPELEELAEKVTAEAHGLSKEEAEELFAKTKLLRRVEAPEEEGEEESEQPGRRSRVEMTEELRKEIARRRTHNAIIQGTALTHMRKAIILAKDKLDTIDPTLYARYQFFTNLGLLGNFIVPIPDALPPGEMQAGQVKLKWNKKDKPQIEAKGLNFPALVQELSKGVLETNMAHGLPRPYTFSEDEYKEYERQTGRVQHELWYFLTGPELSRKLQSFMVKNKTVRQYGEKPNGPRDLMYARTLLATLPEEDLHGVLHKIFTAKTISQEREAADVMRKHLHAAEERYTHE